MMSHIIPRFVAKWLKETSATGFLRRAIDPDLRVQDTAKLPLLCSECENQLSKFESYFAENIFVPFQRDRNSRFLYDESLIKFVVSLSWRLLATEIDAFEKDAPELAKYAREACAIWRDYLTGKRQDSGAYSHHILFIDGLSDVERPIKNFDWYVLRSLDATIVYSPDRVYVYTKLPSIIITSAIHPTDLEGWIGTKISTTGEIGPPQKILNGHWGSFLLTRVKTVFSEEISDTESEKIVQKMIRNPARLLKSDTLQVFLGEHRRKRHLRLMSCTEFIQWLVGRLSEAICSDSVDQLVLDEILDVLTNLSTADAKRLEREMTEAAMKSGNTNSDCSGMTRIGDLAIDFHFCVDSNRKRELVRNALIPWRDKTFEPNVRNVLVIATDSPGREWSNFEIGYLKDRNQQS